MFETDAIKRARKFLAGERLKFEPANALWKQLKEEDQLSLPRAWPEQVQRKRDGPSCAVPDDSPINDTVCREEALLTRKDPELNPGTRHDDALKLLARRFNINNPAMDGDGETLGIAGGICKRRWNDLGQLKDLIQAAEFYERGAKGELGDDAYPHINAAFLDDLLAAAGDRPHERRERAKKLRQRIVDELPVSGKWWNAATRAEALFGLGWYGEATEALKQVELGEKRAAWQLRTMVQQLAQLARLRERQPLQVPKICAFFDTLLPGAADAIRSAIVGKVGLALSGGGF